MATIAMPTLSGGFNLYSSAGPQNTTNGNNVLEFTNVPADSEFQTRCEANDADVVNLIWVDILAATGGVTFDNLALDSAASIANGFPTFNFQSAAGPGNLTLRAQWKGSTIR